ncbi:MAG: type II toxin-antitoxin system Phd/YefM family antitoxin [Lachnospiraceae bacterium]|nr:type II toxin-antitoxin system Phd/YefM family antitoxin [Lachnospiraceae bacterium]
MIVKQGEIRANIKKYFDMAYEGEYILVPRKDNKNVVIISEESFEQMRQNDRLAAYTRAVPELVENRGRQIQTASRDLPQIKSYTEVTDIRTENMNRLEVFKSFKDGWNGYDAGAFDPKLIDKVRDILEKQDIQPEIFPTALGTIQLEYDNSRGDHMEIEVGMEKKTEVFTVLNTGQIITDEIDSDARAIRKMVGVFYG